MASGMARHPLAFVRFATRRMCHFHLFAAASCTGVKNNTAVGLFVQPDTVHIPFGQNLSFICSQSNRPARHSALGETRQCIYDPRTDGLEYWLSGPEVDCPLVDCGPPPALSGAYYEGDEGHLGGNFKVGSVYLFQVGLVEVNIRT